MKRTLHNLSRDELGRLFPVEIAGYNPDWPRIYQFEQNRILKALADGVHRIDHIGSTAVTGLRAKPVIDILLQIKNDGDPESVTDALQNIGYEIIRRPENPAPHLMCVKGYTLQGYPGQAFHVHVRYPGDWDELRFRDILSAQPDIAKDYARLKDELAETYKYDRDAYTDAKTDFIKSALEQGK